MSNMPLVDPSAKNFPGKLVLGLIQKSLAGSPVSLASPSQPAVAQAAGKGARLDIKV